MSYVVSCGCSPGKIEVSQHTIKDFAYNLFSGSGVEIDRLISVFDNSEIERRYISVPITWLKGEHTFSERSSIFQREASNLAKRAIDKCVKRENIKYSDIDCLIFVTSTGVTTPTIDAILFNDLGFGSHLKRIPLWGLGCAGGASAISRALDFTKAYPDKNVLVVTVELCSLTFQKDDLSKSNLIAASLFSDGAGAVFISGEKSDYSTSAKLNLIDSQSTIYSNSLDVMGWDIVDDGFRVLFSRDIPTIVKEQVYPNIKEMTEKYDRPVDQIKHFIAHPGGMKVIDSYEKSIGLPAGVLGYSRAILKQYGNMSSASVLFVLESFLNRKEFSNGEYGIISALGPGFSSELVLFKTL